MIFLIIVVLSILVTLIFTPFVGFWFFVLSLVGWLLIWTIHSSLRDFAHEVTVLFGKKNHSERGSFFIGIAGFFYVSNQYGITKTHFPWWVIILLILLGGAFFLTGALSKPETKTKSKKKK